MFALARINNTAAAVVNLGPHVSLFFSYRTLIAARAGGWSYRCRNFWGPTTARHFKRLGCNYFLTFDGSCLDFQQEAMKRVTEALSR
jgi:hypothetical protein